MGWRMRPRDLPVGAVVGLVMQFVLLPLLYVPILRLFDDLDVEGPARDLTEQAGGPLEIAALVFITVVAAPLTEELFFRGLFQGALRDRLGPVRAVAIASCAFAVVHFQAVQFPGAAGGGVGARLAGAGHRPPRPGHLVPRRVQRGNRDRPAAVMGFAREGPR